MCENRILTTQVLYQMKSEQTKSMHYTVSLISANQNSDFIKIKSDLDVKLCSKLILALVEN